MKRSVGVLAFASLAFMPDVAAADCFLCHWVPEGTCWDAGYSEGGRKSCHTWTDGEGYIYCETYGGPCWEPEGYVSVQDPMTDTTYELAFTQCGTGFTRVFGAAAVPREYALRFTSPTIALALPPSRRMTEVASESREGPDAGRAAPAQGR